MTPPEPKACPVVIRRERCVITIYDINSFAYTAATHLDTRGLWRLMFEEPGTNEGAIDQIRRWLPETVAETKAAIETRKTDIDEAKADLASKESKRYAMGADYWPQKVDYLRSALRKDKDNTDLAEQLKRAIEHRDGPKRAQAELKEAERRLKTAIADHERVVKLQTYFNKLARKPAYKEEEPCTRISPPKC